MSFFKQCECTSKLSELEKRIISLETRERVDIRAVCYEVEDHLANREPRLGFLMNIVHFLKKLQLESK